MKINLVAKINKGFSLIEVLVFISVFSIFFITAIATVTVSLKNMKINEHKILATKYAEELQEWLRREKEIDWDYFVNNRMGTYCFNSQLSNAVPAIWPAATVCSSFNGISTLDPRIFKRELILTKVGDYQVDVDITVSWNEVNKLYSIPLKSTFTVWE